MTRLEFAQERQRRTLDLVIERLRGLQESMDRQFMELRRDLAGRDEVLMTALRDFGTRTDARLVRLERQIPRSSRSIRWLSSTRRFPPFGH